MILSCKYAITSHALALLFRFNVICVVYNVSPAITSDVGDLSRRMSASEYTRLASAVSLRSSSADSTADAMRPYSAMGSAGNAGYGEAVGVNLPKSGSNGSGSSGGVGSNGYVFRKSRAAVQLLDFPTVWVIPFEELVVDKELGRGSFGIVYAGMYGKVRCAGRLQTIEWYVLE